jgi:thioredoxin-dependent peroxiredoxin
MVREEQPAPEFEARDGSGATVRLADFKGRRVVLYFYPKDDAPGCTKEACGFRDEYKMDGHVAEVLAALNSGGEG